MKFSNGTHLYHNLHDPLGVVLDRYPRVDQLRVGLDVIGCIPDQFLMLPGRVKKILENSYEIQFDNGEVHENHLDELRVLKIPKSAGNSMVLNYEN